MNTEEDYLEDVFEKDHSPQEHLPLKPVKIWFTLLIITSIIQVLEYLILFDLPGFYSLTFLSASGLLGVSAAWMLHAPSRINLVKAGVAISFLAFIIFYARATIAADARGGYVTSGIIVFFVLPAILFISYYFYYKAILRHRKNVSKGHFSIRQTPIWKETLKSVISFLVILLGLLLMVESELLAVLVIFLGVYYRFYKNGLDINCATKHYLFYTRHLWYKQGKWLPYADNSVLSVAIPVDGELGKFKQETYQNGRIRNARLFLTTDSEQKPSCIYRFTASEHPFKEAKKLADKMGIALEK